jgi:hypothetical protein
VFGADVAMLQPIAFFVSIGENVFGFGREWQFD